MEVFFLSKSKPSMGSDVFYNCHSALTLYVPDRKAYGNKSNMVQYISFLTSSYTYTGASPKLEWENNLKGYTTTLEEVPDLDKNVGTHTANLKVKYSNGVDITVDIPYEYTISPAPLTLTVNDAEREYGNPNPEFTSAITGFVDGENAQNQNMSVNYTCEANSQSNVGTYRILASVDAPNYEVTYNYGTLTITKAPITVTANDASRLYGDKNPQFELSYTGLRNNETTPNWTQTVSISTTATKASHCGKYPITVSGGVSKNYEVAEYTNGELTINKRQLTVKAIDAQRSYGEDNPTFKASYSGFANSDDEACISQKPTLSCEATKTSNAGTYQISSTGGNSDDYDLVYQPGTLTVKKAPVTVTANNKTRLYGDENPQFDLSYNGLRNDETTPNWTQAANISTTATTKSHCGTYPITVSGGVSQNYEVTKYVSGELEVSKRPLTAKAVDCSRLYGEDNPEFEIAYEGFVNADDESCISKKPTLSCEATRESDASTYQITVTGGKADDYTFTYQNGTLTVNPMLLGFSKTRNTVTYNDMSKSISSTAFEYIPQLDADFDVSDLKINVWALDAENKYSQHVWTEEEGTYAGQYIDYSGPTYVGKYIMTIVGFKNDNPNIQISPSSARAYLTVERASTNLQWGDENPIEITVGETKELDIDYDTDLYCTFNWTFDKDLIQVCAPDKEAGTSKWSIVGVKGGTTELTVNISSTKNDLGFYNFDNSPILTREVKIVDTDGIDSATAEGKPYEIARYSDNGLKLSSPTKGLNIVKYSDGTVKKEIVK